MKFELLQLEEDRIRYLLSGVTAAFANGIRRACMSEVPVLAIDEISLYDNTSVLFDEQISLRLGEVPLQAEDLDIFSQPEECQCGGTGCPGCRVDFMLSSEGPGMVYSKDIQFTDPGVKPAFDKIPIVILGEGEKLVIEGYATKRVGKEHSKWQAGTLCGYKNLPSIEIASPATDAESASRSAPETFWSWKRAERKLQISWNALCASSVLMRASREP